MGVKKNPENHVGHVNNLFYIKLEYLLILDSGLRPADGEAEDLQEHEAD
jgi:hypothetical protein